MRIAVTATGLGFKDEIDIRFGRCTYFLIIDPDSMTVEPLRNTFALLGTGCGIQSALLLIDRGVKVLITGNCGPSAFQVLSDAGLHTILEVSGTVREVVDQYKAGAFKEASSANVDSYCGMAVKPATKIADALQRI